MKNLINDIKAKFGIEGGVFIDAEIESYVVEIDPKDYLAFFKALSEKNEFKKPMAIIAATAKRFIPASKKELLLQSAEQEAKAMYDKFYAENTAMLEFCTANRDTIPSDREFFRNCNYAELKTKHGDKAYTKKELYVLNALGGGDWLIDIKNYENSAVVVAKIAAEIQRAIEIKYLATNSIESKRVKKMIGAA